MANGQKLRGVTGTMRGLLGLGFRLGLFRNGLFRLGLCCKTLRLGMRKSGAEQVIAFLVNLDLAPLTEGEGLFCFDVDIAPS